MFNVENWAEVHRLFHREKWKKTDIAERLQMSRNTVDRLLRLEEPPRYSRPAKGSALDEYEGAIMAMLEENPRVASTVILERLRPLGYRGGITVVKERVATLRAPLLESRSYQRTTYLPGDICQLDWWHTGIMIPVGAGQVREAMGLVTTLPRSAAHATTFTFSRTTADFCYAALGCFERLGGVTRRCVMDNESSQVKPRRRGRRAQLVDQVAALFGQLLLQPVALRPRFPEGKGQDERTVQYLQTSFAPLRRFSSLDDLQDQHDDWALNVAYRRYHRRVGAVVNDAYGVERQTLRALPDPLPDVDDHVEARVMKDGFVRYGGADYSVPPGHSLRRVSVSASMTEVSIHLEGRLLGRHPRSFTRADVVLDPVHEAQLRQHQQARQSLHVRDLHVSGPDLTRYDELGTL
jgi:transposase